MKNSMNNLVDVKKSMSADQYWLLLAAIDPTLYNVPRMVSELGNDPVELVQERSHYAW